MAADDLHLDLCSRLRSLSHDMIHIFIRRALRKHDSQHDPQRLNTVGSNIIARDMDRQTADIAYRR